jgi:predicted DNA-binding transcriptional regulator YafY
MRNQALERSLRLLRLLQRGRRPLDALAVELGVTTRTVRRDLETLSVAGFPIQSVRDDYRAAHVWSVSPDGRCPCCNRV